MKKRLAVVIIIGILILSITGCSGSEDKSISSNGQLTQQQKLKDFEYMYTILKENYPYFGVNKRLNGVDWLANKNKYIEQIKATKSDEDYYETLKGILHQLNNGHARLLNKSEYLTFNKGFKKDEKTYSKAWLDEMNKPEAVKRYSAMKVTKSKEEVPANTNSDNVKTSILEENKVAYLAVHSFFNTDKAKEGQIIKSFLQSIKNYKALVIDIRGNGGGDARYWENNIVPMLLNDSVRYNEYLFFRGGEFVEKFIESKFSVGYSALNRVSSFNGEQLKTLPPEIAKDFKYCVGIPLTYKPKNSVDFQGKIYMLVDRNVFSSSETFAVFAKSTGFATLVGEKTGGDGIGFDPAVCTLPSGYIFEFPLDMGFAPDGTCNFEHKTEPDIKVSAKVGSTFADDEAIKTVLKLVN